MNKSEPLNWLREEHRQWEELLEQSVRNEWSNTA